MSKSNHAMALLAIAAALIIAGCGSGGNGSAYGGKDSTTDSSTSGNQPSPPSGAVVSVGSVPKLGSVLVDSNGLTLYDFHKDKGATSSCYGDCAAVWPPLLTEGKPQTANGAAAAKLGTSERKDGTTQVSYAGHPLYTYAADNKPGDSKGNDIDSFGAEWYALEPSGQEPED